MLTHKSIWWRLGGGLVVASVLATGMVGGLRAQDARSTVVEQLGGTLGVVDYNNLLQAHPDYERLAQFDQQLSGLKAELEAIPLLERDDKLRAAREKLQKEGLKAQAEMEAESNAIAAQMNGMSAAMKNKMDALAAQRQAEMEAKIRDYIKKNGGATQEEEAPPQNVISTSDQAKNLMLLRERKNQAIQLEVEKAHRERVEAERARIDSEIAAYEDEVMRSHQQEKLNLQLKVQVAQDEAEQAELQEQLGAISDEEERLKDAKRAELEAGYKAFRAESDASQSAEIKQKQAAVDREVKAQLGAIPDSLAPEQPRPRSTGPKMTPELQALIKQETARLEAEMQAAADDARQKMEAEQATQMARLKAKQTELKERMAKLQDELKKVLEDTNKQGLSDATKEKLAVKEAQYKELEQQRKELYDKMVADLKGDIGAVAEKNKVDIVIGSYVYRDESRDDCVDLTDYAMVAIKTKARPDSP